MQAMQYLTHKCEQWSLMLSKQSEFKLLLFGSYRLQVHTPSTDIDAICCFKSNLVTRQDFFDTFAKTISDDPVFEFVC